MCSLTAFYDDVNSSLERPPDNIIENDRLLDNWLENIKHQRDLETAKQWAKQGGGGSAVSNTGEGGFSVQDLMGSEDPMAMVQKGGVFNFPNPGMSQSMVLTEPSFEEMQRIHPTSKED